MHVNVLKLRGMKIVSLCVDIHKGTLFELFIIVVLISVLTGYVRTTTRTLIKGLKIYFWYRYMIGFLNYQLNKQYNWLVESVNL